jgi:hypothetical protein
MKKVIWTINIGNYAPEVCALTYPLLKQYAYKIGADFNVIKQRRYPTWPVTYEKIQIFDLGRDNDWNIYIDSDALIHPDFFDVTDHLHKDTVCHNGHDMAGNRWRYDNYFRRDGRHIGSCNWFTIGSDWCMDLWHPLDIPLNEALANIFPIVAESSPIAHERDEDGNRKKDDKGAYIQTPKQVITREHLIDDYTLSRNIARYGLKFTNLFSIKEKIGDKGEYFWHAYQIPVDCKITKMKEVLDNWGIVPKKETA